MMTIGTRQFLHESPSGRAVGIPGNKLQLMMVERCEQLNAALEKLNAADPNKTEVSEHPMAFIGENGQARTRAEVLRGEVYAYTLIIEHITPDNIYWFTFAEIHDFLAYGVFPR